MTEGGWEALSFPSARFLSPHSFREVNRETAKVHLSLYPRRGGRGRDAGSRAELNSQMRTAGEGS